MYVGGWVIRKTGDRSTGMSDDIGKEGGLGEGKWVGGRGPASVFRQTLHMRTKWCVDMRQVSACA